MIISPELRTDLADQYVNSPLGLDKLFVIFGSITPWTKKYGIVSIRKWRKTTVRVTRPNVIAVGDVVQFTGLDNTTGAAGLNSVSGTVTSKPSEDTVVLNVNSTAVTNHVSGGVLVVTKTYVDENDNKAEILKKTVGMKAVTGEMMCHVVKRYDWTKFDTYQVFDPNSNQVDQKFYAFSNGNIYVCLSNSAGRSSRNKPNGNNRFPQQYPDGYTWLFVQEVKATDLAKFGDSEYLPVRPLLIPNVLAGSILAINVVEQGAGYKHGDEVVVSGDGVSARFQINSFSPSGGILSLYPKDRGKHYTWSTAWIKSSGGSGAVLKPLVNSFADDMLNPVKMLHARGIRFVIDVKGSENGNLYVGPIRSYGVIRMRHDKQLTDFQSSLTVLENGAAFSNGDTITGLMSGTTATVSSSAEQTIKYVEKSGDGFIGGEIVRSGTKTAIVSKISENDNSFLFDSCVLFMHNYEGVYNRNENQIDLFTATIQF